MHFDIILNPAGASGKTTLLWEKYEELFKEAGSEYTLHKSTKEKGIEALVRELTALGEERKLIVIGGDGTLRGGERLSDLFTHKFGNALIYTLIHEETIDDVVVQSLQATSKAKDSFEWFELVVKIVFNKIELSLSFPFTSL